MTTDSTTINSDTIIEQLYQNQNLISDSLKISMQGCVIELVSNSSELLSGLEIYFRGCQVLYDAKNNANAKHHLKIEIIESAPVTLAIDFIDWKREPGKSGRKDAYYDFEDQGQAIRLVQKVRTGMVFLQSSDRQIAAGPCVANDNQVINFINSQYMNWLQNNNWLICHASGLVYQDNKHSYGIGMAGLSGGGKSTLMLKLLERSEFSYMTNDRLFIRNESGSEQIEMCGIPKLPRINPGTIIGNPKLHSILSDDKKSYFQQMPTEQLWDIEEKYDVDIAATYGDKKLKHQANLNKFIILNWQRNGSEPTRLSRINIEDRHDILPAIMKSPGPFYLNTEGKFEQDTNAQDKNHYLQLLKNIEIYEVNGGVDFDQLTTLCFNMMN
ncbi:MAG: HprK-related kinase B [Gammaproteobacteria bacterium]|nr:HprK-related kinase B [Gammaproteobacteria bacterium]